MALRRRRGNTVIPYSRDYRRAPRWGMGLPPRKPQSHWCSFVARALDPVFYLKAVIAVGALALIVLPLGADAVNAALKPAWNGDNSCRIMSVIDGDTLSIWCTDRGIERARLIGLDAPELFSPGCGSEFLAAQRATWALRGMIFQARAINIGIEGRDRYDRLLVTLSLDGRAGARQMIARGHAREYDGGQRQSWCEDGSPRSNA